MRTTHPPPLTEIANVARPRSATQHFHRRRHVSSSFLPQRFFVLGVLLLSFSAATVRAKPYWILTSSRSKCVSLVVPQDQTISVEYDAPDMQLLNDVDDEKNKQRNLQQESSGIDESDGMDAEWNQRMKDKLARMKAKKMKDMTLTINQKQLDGSSASKTDWYKTQKNNNKQDSKMIAEGRIRQELTSRQGTVLFRTNSEAVEGTVEVCIQSILASRQAPSRVMVHILYRDDDYTPSGNAGADGDNLAVKDVKSNMSRLERDLNTMRNRVRTIVNNADVNKDQEAAFHGQSIAMNKSVTYWPIIQVMVVLITGFTQVQHIVRYMRSHHVGL